MTIAVASGKGGTGKTTVAVGLALCAREPVMLLDCDVEEPNARLFLEQMNDLGATRSVDSGTRPTRSVDSTATVPVPTIDQDRCTGCGECSRACMFNALISLPESPMLVPELCHGCGVCVTACPEGAITESPRPIGTVRERSWGSLDFVDGTLNVGEAMATPLIRAVRSYADPDRLVLIDAPPGVSCPAIVSMRGSDLVILVAEPTRFGLHDLRLAVEAVETLGIPCRVVINRSDIGTDDVRDYCERAGIPVVLEIPYSRDIAASQSRGEIGLSRALLDDLSGIIDNVAYSTSGPAAYGATGIEPAAGCGVGPRNRSEESPHA